MLDKEEKELFDLMYKSDLERCKEQFAMYMEHKYPGSKVEILEGGFRISAKNPDHPKLIANEFEDMKNYKP